MQFTTRDLFWLVLTAAIVGVSVGQTLRMERRCEALEQRLRSVDADFHRHMLDGGWQVRMLHERISALEGAKVDRRPPD